jgi:hypothetical protein
MVAPKLVNRLQIAAELRWRLAGAERAVSLGRPIRRSFPRRRSARLSDQSEHASQVATVEPGILPGRAALFPQPQRFVV